MRVGAESGGGAFQVLGSLVSLRPITTVLFQPLKQNQNWISAALAITCNFPSWCLRSLTGRLLRTLSNCCPSSASLPPLPHRPHRPECRDLRALIHLHPQVGTFGKVQRSGGRNVCGGFWVSDLRETVHHKKNRTNSSALLYAFDPYINTSAQTQPPKAPRPTSVFTLNNFKPPTLFFPSTFANSFFPPLKSLPLLEESLAVLVLACVRVYVHVCLCFS